MENKYIQMFDEMAAKKGFKYAVDYMGTYFMGLMDNISYDDFLEVYYRDFMTFITWLLQNADEEIWTQTYRDKKPLLLRLSESINEVMETPDSIEVALRKAENNLTPESVEALRRVADHFIDENKQLFLHVETYRDGKELHVFDDKFTKKEQRENKMEVKEDLSACLALIIRENGYLTLKQKERGRETISAFVGSEDGSLTSVSEQDLEDLFEDYVIAQKEDVDIQFECYSPNGAFYS